MGQRTDVTVLLNELAAGDAGAADRLLPILYDELRAIAGAFFRHERVDHTLQPTALVNEAYLKLLGSSDGPPVQATSRAHFLALAAKVMRQLLIDHARARKTQKRGGQQGKRVSDTIALARTPSPDVPREASVLDLDEAMQELAKAYPRAARVVELKFFGGLTAEEIGSVLGIGDATVERDWALARGWLNRRLHADGAEPGKA
ncbi:MAG: sigma-70 family RNA polymerase sigma factor [Planctomycetes bacterium]|nr:sigma-70 family RNA polymerase sigma factor [Planctomycetota bacterium]